MSDILNLLELLHALGQQRRQQSCGTQHMQPGAQHKVGAIQIRWVSKFKVGTIQIRWVSSFKVDQFN